MTREYSCRKCLIFNLIRQNWFSFVKHIFCNQQHQSLFFPIPFLCVDRQINPTAELRTISLCDSDLLLHNYNATHRKLSEQSPEISYYSGTESQQSISDRSFYDNVDGETRSRNILFPPMVTFKNSSVNRSKSFQETGQCHAYLSPRANNISLIRRKLQDSNSFHNRSSVSPFGSTLSEPNVDCSAIQTTCKIVQPNCSCDKKRTGPFYIKLLRRVQKLSLQWRKCKKVHRGRSFAKWNTYININNFLWSFRVKLTNWQ